MNDTQHLTQDTQTQTEREPSQDITLQALSQEPITSIKPSIAEIERFIGYLNNRFNLMIGKDLIVLIQETKPQTLGVFKTKDWKTDLMFKHTNQESQEPTYINSITISSHLLKGKNPYETIAHELAHYLDLMINGISSLSKNNYHSKRFKAQAERLLLEVEKGKYGFNVTSESQAFKEMLQDYKPNHEVFKIFQDIRDKKLSESRLLLFECECFTKIRCARNEIKPLIATCGYCGTQFKEVLK